MGFRSLWFLWFFHHEVCLGWRLRGWNINKIRFTVGSNMCHFLLAYSRHTPKFVAACLEYAKNLLPHSWNALKKLILLYFDNLTKVSYNLWKSGKSSKANFDIFKWSSKQNKTQIFWPKYNFKKLSAYSAHTLTRIFTGQIGPFRPKTWKIF